MKRAPIPAYIHQTEIIQNKKDSLEVIARHIVRAYRKYVKRSEKRERTFVIGCESHKVDQHIIQMKNKTLTNKVKHK